jgi:hypothetical protein
MVKDSAPSRGEGLREHRQSMHFFSNGYLGSELIPAAHTTITSSAKRISPSCHVSQLTYSVRFREWGHDGKSRGLRIRRFTLNSRVPVNDENV